MGLDKIIEKRVNKTSLGFNSELNTEEKKTAEFIKQMQPQDLIKYGLIPEFVGRLPIVVGLNELDEEALVSILTKPRNALVKQYKTLFKLDGVKLEIEDDAIRAVAKKAIKLKTGARGLRTILEDSMLNIMFFTPSDKSIEKVVVTEDTIINKSEPTIIRKHKEKSVDKVDDNKNESIA